MYLAFLVPRFFCHTRYNTRMLHIALYQPEIPPNTGNIIRLCANTGTQLHLIHPLGFELADAQLRRAGLDYHEFAHIQEYANYAAFLETNAHRRMIACSTRGQVCYNDMAFQDEDLLLFGPETRGLSSLLKDFPASHIIRIPMQANSRSLNLANSVAVILYEAWSQLGFPGAEKN